MASMVLSSADSGSLGPAASKSAKNRQFSVYASRIRLVDELAPPQVPQPPPTISPRWDSLQNGDHVKVVSPTLDSFDHVFYDTSESLKSPTSAAFQDETLPLALDSSLPSTHHMTTKSFASEMRQSSGSVGNFSRPRKPSIKQPLHSKPSLPELSRHLHDLPPAPHSPSWRSRSRAPSSASATSIYTFASPPNNTFWDPSTPASPRLRTAPQSASTTNRPNFGFSSRPDLTSVPPAATTPWMGGDELRSSFRSQLTTSTTPGTAATERSSVMTKDSSVSSLYANVEPESDEPSLEDVMGMYEKGFKDDTDDDDAVAAAADDNDMAPISRQLTTLSETDPTRLEIENSHPPSTTPTTLDAEIRQSKMLFSSPAFTSMLPAIAGDSGKMDDDQKRDSAKSIGSDSFEAFRPASVDAKVSVAPPPPVTVSPVTVPPLSGPVSLNPTSLTPSSPAPAPAASEYASASVSSAAPAPAPQSYAEIEEPGSRDRYGFKKESHSVTRAQYDEWNKNYSQYLARRRRKWVAYLKDNALMTDRPIRFPAACAKTKRFVRKGIPPDWRGAAWFYYAGGPAILSQHSGLYEKLLTAQAKQIDVDAIERDLHRTFPDNIQFKPSPGGFDTSASSSERQSQSTLTDSDTSESARAVPGEPPIITSLRRVLHAFSIYNPHIGYCQSLNFLAGLLLLFVETEEHCFWLLNVITHVYLPGTHELSLEGSKVDLGVLMAEIRDTMPEVWDRIGGELEEQTNFKPTPSRSLRRPLGRSRHRGQPSLSTERLPPITLCMTAWFMSCFIGTLPIETTLRVWDVFFYEGSKTLFRVALAIFKQGESEIKAISDPMEMFGVVQALPRKMLDANLLMEQCFKRRNGFNHLNQDVIDHKRRQRRDKARKDREQLENSQTAMSEKSTESQNITRRGTLFGKKQRAT